VEKKMTVPVVGAIWTTRRPIPEKLLIRNPDLDEVDFM